LKYLAIFSRADFEEWQSVERQVLRAGLLLEYVIGDLKFCDDVLDNAAQLELTAMALPVQPLPLRAFRLPHLIK